MFDVLIPCAKTHGTGPFPAWKLVTILIHQVLCIRHYLYFVDSLCFTLPKELLYFVDTCIQTLLVNRRGLIVTLCYALQCYRWSAQCRTSAKNFGTGEDAKLYNGGRLIVPSRSPEQTTENSDYFEGPARKWEIVRCETYQSKSIFSAVYFIPLRCALHSLLYRTRK